MRAIYITKLPYKTTKKSNYIRPALYGAGGINNRKADSFAENKKGVTMKLKAKVFALTLILFALFTVPILTSCGKQNADNNATDEVKTYTVTFVVDGAETATQQIKESEKAVKPLDPEKTNYVFVGWFNGDTEWDFETMQVRNSITLTAKWTAEFTPPYLPRS